MRRYLALSAAAPSYRLPSFCNATFAMSIGSWPTFLRLLPADRSLSGNFRAARRQWRRSVVFLQSISNFGDDVMEEDRQSSPNGRNCDAPATTFGPSSTRQRAFFWGLFACLRGGGAQNDPQRTVGQAPENRPR